MQTNARFQDSTDKQRDVSSTAKLFNFNRPVFMSESVWRDCVELTDVDGRMTDELTVLQRLRHVLFMAATAMHGQTKDLECKFHVHRVPNNGLSHRPEPTTLKIVTNSELIDEPYVTIKHYSE